MRKKRTSQWIHNTGIDVAGSGGIADGGDVGSIAGIGIAGGDGIGVVVAVISSGPVAGAGPFLTAVTVTGLVSTILPLGSTLANAALGNGRG